MQILLRLPLGIHPSPLICVSLFLFFEGDKLYCLSSGEAEKNGTTEDHLQDSQDSGLHRIVILGSHALQLQITVSPKYNHLLPVDEQALSNDLGGQLWFAPADTQVSHLLWIHHTGLFTGPLLACSIIRRTEATNYIAISPVVWQGYAKWLLIATWNNRWVTWIYQSDAVVSERVCVKTPQTGITVIVFTS